MGKTKSTNPAEAYRESMASKRHNPFLMRSRQGSAKEGAYKGWRPVFPYTQNSYVKQNKEARKKTRELGNVKKDTAPLEEEIRELEAKPCAFVCLDHAASI